MSEVPSQVLLHENLLSRLHSTCQTRLVKPFCSSRGWAGVTPNSRPACNPH